MGNPDDMSAAEFDCGDAELLKGCKTVQEGDANYDACLKKKASIENGKKVPFCTDGTVAKCPAGYNSYTKKPPCIGNSDPTQKHKMVCMDGTTATDCKKKKNRKNPECVEGAKKMKRFMCADGKKGSCPEGYSKGECLNVVTGERKHAKCSHEEGNKERAIKCFKENEDNPLCANTSGNVCESTGEAPTCPENYEFNIEAYQKDIEQPEALVLKAGRPGGPHGPHGRGDGPRGPHGPHGRPPFGKGGEVSVDFLCLKVDLN